ncbi:MAG: anthranilate synthase component I, partial [Myxococcota bacterium]
MMPEYRAREMHADLDTPVSAYLKLAAGNPWSFLYESVEGAERWASYSIIGVGARRSFTVRGETLTVEADGETTTFPAQDPLDALREASGFPHARPVPGAGPFLGGLFGFLSYDAVRSFEPLQAPPGPSICADACFFQPEVLAVFDNRRHRLTLYAIDESHLDEAEQRMRAPVRETRAAGDWREPRALDSREDFMAMVEATKEHIRAGDIIQAVVSRRFALDRASDPFD